VIISAIEPQVNANLRLFLLGCVWFRGEIRKREVCKRECKNTYGRWQIKNIINLMHYLV